MENILHALFFGLIFGIVVAGGSFLTDGIKAFFKYYFRDTRKDEEDN